jgi:single-strand DNA-binding protein
MNKVILMGRLTRDPDVRWTQGQDQKCIARFTLAVDRRYKKDGEQSADFISCVSFGKTAEFAEKYLHKGTKVACEGRWQTGSYDNKEGQKVYTNDCVIEQMEFAESKKSESGQATNSGDDFMNIPDGIDDECPFG